jgi:ADP-ribose pyrophosphatase YjhB (NUDIX family)
VSAPDRVTVWPVDALPQMTVVDPPTLPRDSAADLAAERRRMAADCTLTDGRVIMVAAAAAERLIVFEATYAWHLVDRRDGLPGVAGGLGVQLALTTPDGLVWQRRGPGVDHPLSWSISAAGTVQPGAGLEEQIVAEAREELGLRRDDLAGLRPLAVVVGERRRIVEVVFTARLPPGAELRPDGAEVTEVRVARTPADLPGGLESLTAGWWPELVRLATGYG